MTTNSHHFDKIYLSDTEPWGSKPSNIVEKFTDHLQGETVLDIGAGDGRNAIHLAKQGFKVYALDFAAEGLKNLMVKAHIYGVRDAIVPIVASFPAHETTEQYDNVISTFTLHFAESGKLTNFLHRAMELTRPAGIMLIEDFNGNGTMAVNPDNYMDEQAIVDHYRDAGWHIHHSETQQTSSRQKNANGTPILTEKMAIVAQKPPL